MALYGVKGLLRDQRLVPVPYDDPFVRLLFLRFLAFEADLVSLPLRDMPQVDHILQDSADADRGPRLAPGVDIRVEARMRLATVYRRRRFAALVEQACNLRRPFSRSRAGEHLPHDCSRVRVWNQMVLVRRVLAVPVRGKIADELACLHFSMQGAADLAAGVARVHFVDDVAKRREVGIRPRGVDAIVD